MGLATRLIAGAFLLLAASAATAQPRRDRNCTDDQGVDRCAAEQQRRTRELFGVRSIEEHRDAGDQVRRIFYVDGYGRDMVVISFVRAPGREPMAYVHFSRREGRPVVAPLESPVPHAVWREVLMRSGQFDRTYVSPPEDPNSISLCIHSWVYTIEANDPARSNLGPASLRRKTEDACQDGPGEEFARELQNAALPLFPHCARLDPAKHRNPASQLAACALLRGDRMAAAEVMNRLDAFRNARRADESHELAGFFAHRASIDWQGTRSGPDDRNLQDFWIARMVAEGSPGFYLDWVEGLRAERVRVSARVERSVDGPEGARATFYRAPVEMIWALTPSQEFQVESVTVGAWETYRPAGG